MFICEKCMSRLVDDPKQLPFFYMNSISNRKCQYCQKENMEVDWVSNKTLDYLENKNDKKRL